MVKEYYKETNEEIIQYNMIQLSDNIDYLVMGEI